MKAQVTSAQRVANVTSIQQTANELNTAMGQFNNMVLMMKMQQNKLKIS
ncbi:hypothetical protein ACVPOY_10765 [Staphylococcus aureus]